MPALRAKNINDSFKLEILLTKGSADYFKDSLRDFIAPKNLKQKRNCQSQKQNLHLINIRTGEGDMSGHNRRFYTVT